MRPVTTLLVLSAAVALACPSLTSCGAPARASASATGPTGPTGPTGLCGSIGQIDRLVVQRIDQLPQNHPSFTFPTTTTITGPARTREVAEAACALPPMPSGTFACPADMGIVYRLTFTGGGKELPQLQADPSGCGQVTGLGQTRWTITSSGFWPALAAAMGVTPQTTATFLGTIS